MTAREATLWRTRLVTACLLISALSFRQEPNLIAPDTKLDLTANPGAFLARALTVWDPGFLGQLQNQAYGYLFPVGPFHWLLGELGVPAWIVQRAWWSVVLCVAFLGMWRLAAALGVGTPWTRYLAAFLFALSPRFLGEIAITSVEVWPMAMAPWVLVPLVDPRPATLPHRIGRSALAFGLIGGINAVATSAALVLPTLWFLTGRGVLGRVITFAAWLGACILVSLWWLVPLMVLGQYSPPFLDWIEDSSVTTGTASAVSALQGTSAWLSYLSIDGTPSWPAAWLFVSQPVLIVVTLAVPVIGLIGLSRRDLPWRGWLLSGLAVGAALLTIGFARSAPGPFVEQVRAVLDGPLAALRNIHKFELVIRIPLVLGMAHALTQLPRALPERAGRVSVAVVAAALVVVGVAPGLASALPRAGSYVDIPEYWRQTASWLDARPGPGAVLVVPAASFADLTWGSPRDEPLQALMKRPFVVRDAVPLGGAGSIRLLDEIERRLRTGSGGAEVRKALVQAGIRYVVVRNDLTVRARTSPPVAVHEALDESGIRRVASYGPPAGSRVETRTLTVDERTLLPYPSVEIFDAGPVTVADYVPVSRVRTIIGGPEDALTMSALLPGGTGILAPDGSPVAHVGEPVGEVLTDGMRRREVAFGRASENTSEILTPDDRGRSGRRTIDYLPDGLRPLSALAWQGVSGVRSSSSASDATASLRLGPGYSPASALDGDPDTRWISGRYLRAVGEWLEVSFTQPTDVTGTSVVLSDQSPVEGTPVRIQVQTDRGSLDQDARVGTPWQLRTPQGTTTRLRITLKEVSGAVASGFSIAELSVPGLTTEPRVVVTQPAAGAPDLIDFRVQEVGSSGCDFAGTRPLCAASNVDQAEEAGGLFRQFTTGSAADYTISGRVLPRPSEQLNRLLDLPGRAVVTATSSAVPGPAGRPGAVLDDDLGTGWVASAADPQPELRLQLPRPQPVRGLQFIVDDNLAGSRPTEVVIDLGKGRRLTRTVDADGRVTFPRTLTETLTVTLSTSRPTTNIDAKTRFRSPLPVGVSELRVLGAGELSHPVATEGAVESACGFGPTVSIDGISRLTRVRGTVDDVLRSRPLRWDVCGGAAGPIWVPAGQHVFAARSSAEFRPAQVLFRKVGSSVSSSQAMAPQVTARADQLEIGPRAEPGVLVLKHTYNAGWAARTTDGRELVPVRVMGWQQGFVIPAGHPVRVATEFTPQRPYLIGLLGGLVAFLCVAVIALVGWPRASSVVPRADDSGARPAMAVMAGAAILNAGLVGAAALAVAAVIGVAGRLRRGVVRWSMLGVGIGLGWLVASQPWGAGGAALDSSVAQFGAWLLLTVAVLSQAGGAWTADSVEPGDGREVERRRPSDMMGRSMNR